MSTKGTVRYDEYLTNLSLAYNPGNLIGEIVAPLVDADYFSDYVFVDSEDKLNQVNDMAEGTPSNEVDDSVGTPYTYRTTRKALNSVITDKEMNNVRQKKVIKLEQRKTDKLTRRLQLRHEARVAAIMTNTAKVTQTKNVDAVATKRWDETAPDLEGDIITAAKTIHASTGAKPNTIIIPFDAALYAANMSFIKDTLKYQHGMEVVSGKFRQQVMELVGLPPFIKGLRVIISDGRKNVAMKGQTKSTSLTWGKDCLIGYIPPNPSQEDIFGILTMEYDSRKVSREMLTDPRGRKILVEWDYDILEAELKTWYLLQNVIG